jgi:trimethylamine:corrinoid methyltransferase-like protein
VLRIPEFSERFRTNRRFDLMTDEERRAVHEAALEVLENPGIRVHSPTARQALKGAGAAVNETTHDVRFPPGLVASLMKSAPREIVLAGRTREFDLPFNGTHNYITTDACGIAVWDDARKTRRKPVLDDVRKTAVLADYLPYISLYTPMVVASDVPERAHVVSGVRVAMENTQKHIESESTSNAKEAEAEVAMAAAVLGSREELFDRHYLSAVTCTVSPLILDEAATEAAMVFASNHVPIHCMSMAHAGISAPVTLAGDLVVNHAETLALMCAAQAKSPGAPVMYGSCLSQMDPRTGAYQGGSPEALLLCAATVEMAKHIRVPISAGGFGSSAKIPGIQASIEGALSAIIQGLVGAELVNGIGEADGSMVLSYEQLLIDHDTAAMALRMCQGIDVTPETLAVDLIRKVGIGGSYLAQMHTIRHMREIFLPMLWDTNPYEDWEHKGKKDPFVAAREKADAILAEHKPVPLDRNAAKQLEAVAKDFLR